MHPFPCSSHLGVHAYATKREDTMHSMDFGAFGFWLFIAALVVAGYWKETRQNAEKHETLRRMIEKTGVIDEVKLREVFSSATEEKSKPGSNYRGLRIAGTIIVFVGAAMA